MPITPSDFYYDLPPKLIAQTPVEPRDSSRLMRINRHSHQISHHHFSDILQLLSSNDVLVLNETKVFPARLYGNKQGGGPTEILLIKPLGNNIWECLGKNLKTGSHLDFSKGITGTIQQKFPDSGTAIIHFSFKSTYTLDQLIQDQGHTPIPPYIESSMTENELRSRYQTIYATQTGSVAAPTAGLHFTNQLLDQCINQGVQVEKVTLHVGPGTFGTLYPHHIEQKKLHTESFHIERTTIDRLQSAKTSGKRIIAVGTTTCRTLETVFQNADNLNYQGETSLFIMPPYQFKFVDALITNFHLPESSLLMLVTAFTSSPNTNDPYTSFPESLIGEAYQTAIDHQYRFFSFGDAMFID